jgi:hypothetical protein
LSTNKLRFIRDEPWIARTLRTFRPLNVIPEDLHEWFWDWVEDVGTVMRSREMMVTTVASMAYYAILMSALSMLEVFGVKSVKIVKKLM